MNKPILGELEFHPFTLQRFQFATIQIKVAKYLFGGGAAGLIHLTARPNRPASCRLLPFRGTNSVAANNPTTGPTASNTNPSQPSDEQVSVWPVADIWKKIGGPETGARIAPTNPRRDRPRNPSAAPGHEKARQLRANLQNRWKSWSSQDCLVERMGIEPLTLSPP